MKNMIVLAAIVGMAQFASADIPLPHNPSRQTESKSHTYSGERAEEMYKRISGEEILGSSSGWSGEVQTYKVERSRDGLEQTVCSKQHNMRKKSPAVYSCTEETSENGRPLPEFRTTPRLG